MNAIVGALFRLGVTPAPPLGRTVPVVAEPALVDPPELWRSRSRRVACRRPSDAVGLAVRARDVVAARAAESQRCHWYANERTPPVHVPGDAVSSSPTWAVPETLGFTEFTGSFRDETRSVGFEPAVDWPSAFDAVTITRSV
jgi:hypothetical protein